MVLSIWEMLLVQQVSLMCSFSELSINSSVLQDSITRPWYYSSSSNYFLFKGDILGQHSEKWGFGNNDPSLCSTCRQHWAASTLVLSWSWTSPWYLSLVGAPNLPARLHSSLVPVTLFIRSLMYSFIQTPSLLALVLLVLTLGTYFVLRLRPCALLPSMQSWKHPDPSGILTSSASV